MTSNREESLFAAALALPCAERAAFLERECGGDVELRRRVARLLVSFEATANPLVTQLDAAGAGVSPLMPGDDDRVGQKLGRYKLLEKLGEGGCGVVYVAEQTEPVRRRVALKVIKLGMDTKAVVARFEAERQALALMDHPNIAKVLDAGTTEAGRPFFVMELVRGIRITDYCDQAQLGTKERLDLFIKVCHAIQHAHQKGIIHRDIKPSYILVTLHDGVPVPKVIDFGIAKATEGRLTDNTVYTQLNQFIGTPAYMSPEQAEMSGLDIDTRSDIYALGVLLYELLTGKTPFDAKELMAAGLDAMRKTIRERDPARPSTKLATLVGEDLTTTAKRRSTETAKLVSQLKGDLDWIVMKCLEKDRTRRYETATGLASDITRHLTSEPVAARPPTAVYKLQKAFRRNRLIYASGLIVFLALFLGVVLSGWQAVRADREARNAERAEHLAQQRLAESESISKFMIEVFQSPDPSRDGRLITVAETLGAAAKKLETDLVNQPERKAHLQAVLGKTYYGLGLYKEASELLERARSHFVSARGPDDLATLDVYYDLALANRFAGRRSEALALLKVVVEKRTKILGLEHPDTLLARERLGFSLFQMGSPSEGVAILQETLSMSRRVLKSDHSVTLLTMDDLMVAYNEDSDRRREGIRIGEEALAIRKRGLGPEHLDTLTSMLNLSDSYQYVGRIREALALRESVYASRRRILGGEHPDTLKVLNRVGESYVAVGRVDEAATLEEDLLTVERRVDGPEHPRTIGVMFTLTSCLSEVGRISDALEVSLKALTAAEHYFGSENLVTLGAVLSVSFNYMDLGEPEKGLQFAQRALEALLRNPSISSLRDRQAVFEIATAQGRSALGEKKEAAKLAVKALDDLRRILGEGDLDVIVFADLVAFVLENAGLNEEALGIRERLLASARRAFEKGHPETSYYTHALARAYLRLGRLAEAEALCREPAGVSERNPSWSRWVLVRRGLLGMILVAQKQDAAAEPELVASFEELRPRFLEFRAMHRRWIVEPAHALAELFRRTGRPERADAVENEIKTMEDRARRPKSTS